MSRVTWFLAVMLTAWTLSAGNASGEESHGPATRASLPPLEGWKATADPFEMKGHYGDIKLAVPIKGGNKLAVSERNGPFISIGDDDWGKQAWALVDLRTGGLTPGPRGMLHLEDTQISPDGQYLVGKASAKFGEQPTIDVYSFKSKQLVAHLRSPEPGQTPQILGFLDQERLLTFMSKDWKPLLHILEIKTDKVIASIQPDKLDAQEVAISPGGKFFATANEHEIKIYNSIGEESGTALIPAMTETGLTDVKANPKHLAFSPSGNVVAAICEIPWHGDKKRIIEWDMGSGQITKDQVIGSPGDEKRKQLKFEVMPDDLGWRFEREILDRESGKKVYSIPQSRQGHEDDFIRVLDAGRVLEVSEKEFGGKAVQITTVKLPHDELAKATAAVRAGGSEIDVKLPPITAADVSNVRDLAPAKQASWDLTPDDPARAPQEEQSTASPGKGLSLQVKGVEATPHRVVFSGSPSHSAAVTYHLQPPGGPVQKTYLQVIGLTSRQVSCSIEIPVDAEALDLSADGRSILVRTGPDRVDLFSTASAVAKPVCGWRPYEKLPGNGSNNWTFFGRAASDVVWGAVVDNGHVLTCSGGGKLALWSVPGCKAEWSMPLSLTMPQLSPARKWIAAAAEGFIHFINPLSGEEHGALAAPGASPNNECIAFRPDGKLLTRCTRGQGTSLTVWSLTEGKVVNETCLPGEMTPDVTCSWSGNNHLLLGRSLLVNLDLHISVWKFLPEFGAGQPTGQPDSRVWMVVRGQGTQPWTLVGYALPNDEARSLEAALHPSQIVVVKPGTKVSIQTTLIGDAETQQKVITALKQHAEESGLVVADGQPVQLVASVQQSGSRKMQYLQFGGSGKASDTVDIPEYTCKLSIVANGKAIWWADSRGGGGAPTFVRLEKGQTIQQFIAKINANPGSWFFQTTHIPGWIGTPLDHLTTSRFTPTGITVLHK